MCPHAYSWLAATALLSMLACSDKQTPVAPPFDLAYATNPAVYEVGTSIPANPASCRGGPVQQFTVTPDLPGGLVLDAITGAITGTPTTIAPEATYAVVARNRAGLATAAVTITVNDAEPTGLSYATNPATYVGGAAITPNAPISGGGAIVSFSVSPALPPGLSLDPATGVITGTPMALADGAWTVTATNSGGATSASLAIHVVAPPPPVVTTQPAPAAVYQGQVATFTVAASGVWLSYQWRVDGADVPGATAPSYSTPPLEISEDGARYDVVVHDPFGGATTSAPAAVAVKTGTFSSVGAMQSEHAYHTATRLADGRVLIAGGEAETWRPSAFAELYDPDTGTFSTTGAMQVARLRHSATLLHTGEVLIAGGFTPTGVTTTAELYDSAAGTFRFTGSMAVFRDRHTATLLPDGTVLVAGGRSRGDFDFPVTQVTTSGAEVYDPSTGQFTTVHPMTCARAQHTATLLANGDVLIAGGYVEKVGDEAGTIGPVVWVFSAGLERYSPSMGTFARVGESWSRHGHTATQGAGGSVLLAGGFCGAPSATDWSRQATTPAAELFDGGAGTALAVARMAGSRTYHTATVLPGGSVLVAGGIWVPERQDPAARQGPIGLDTAELFEPATGVFSGTGSMTRPRSGHAATLLPDGGVLVTGGASGSRAAEVFR